MLISIVSSLILFWICLFLNQVLRFVRLIINFNISGLFAQLKNGSRVSLCCRKHNPEMPFPEKHQQAYQFVLLLLEFSNSGNNFLPFRLKKLNFYAI